MRKMPEGVYTVPLFPSVISKGACFEETQIRRIGDRRSMDEIETSVMGFIF